jgi:hypothetical protein
LGKAKTRYVKEHYKEVKVRRDFYEELRKIAEGKGLSVPALIEEMFKQYTAPSMPRGVEVRKRDYFWWTIRVGEGWNAIETDLNNIQLRKLCQARLLVKEVCEKIDISKL